LLLENSINFENRILKKSSSVNFLGPCLNVTLDVLAMLNFNFSMNRSRTVQTVLSIIYITKSSAWEFTIELIIVSQDKQTFFDTCIIEKNFFILIENLVLLRECLWIASWWQNRFGCRWHFSEISVCLHFVSLNSQLSTLNHLIR